MAAGAQEHVPRNTDIRPDDDVVEAVQSGARPDPGVVSDRKLPRPLNRHPTPDQHAFADLRAEPAQDLTVAGLDIICG